MKKKLATVMAATMAVSGSVVSVSAATTNEQLVGSNRTDTAVKISKDGWNSAETVILVNDSAIPDALTATPLAFAKNAPILLTAKGGLTKATANEIKRLGAKNVILIGGETVLPAKIENDLKALNVKSDRVKGATREETALAIAKRLDGIKDVSEIAVVNGTTGLADAVSVAAAAAEKGMPILLANPKKGLTASEKFIKDEAIKASFIIGGTTALPEKLVSSLPGKQRIEGSNRNDTNAKVIEKFYGDKELDNLYLAKDGRGGDSQLIDALAVGVLAAKNGAPVLIASKKLNAKQEAVVNTKKVDTITQVGGNGNEGAFNHLKEIEKVETIKVKTEAELQEALKKANANDIIEIDSSTSISKDLTIATNNAVEINVKGDLKGEVTVKAPNEDIKNSGTIGTLVVENGKNTTVTNTSAGKIDKVEVDSSSSNVKVENNGTITQVENNATGTNIENNGTISKPVTGTTTPNVEGNKPGSGSSTGGGSSIDQGKVALVDKVKDAAKYEYKENPYTYTGEVRVTGTESANVVIAGPYKNEEASLKNAMNDMARYLGALHRVDNGATISVIKYNGKEYTWDNEGKLRGSNWKSGDKTLVSAIVGDIGNMSLEDMSKKSLNLTLVGKNGKEVSMSMTLKQEFPVEANGVGYATLQEAINANGEVKLLKDVTVSEEIKIGSTENEVINLNGKTLSSSYTKEKGKSVIKLDKGKSLTIKDGNLDLKSYVSTLSCIGVETGGSITLSNVKYTTDGSGIMVIGDAASVNVTNGTEINALGYGVSTNASTTANNGVIINLENSKFNATCTDKNTAVGTPILLNVKCKSFKMNGCEVNGIYQGVIIRGSEATIENTTIRNKVSELPYNKDYKDEDGDWRSGNEIPRGALVIGNRHKTAYQNSTTVTLNGCTIEEQSEGNPAIFVWGNNESQKATLNYDKNTKILKGELIKGNEHCVITNGHLHVVDKTQTTSTK